VDNIAYRLKSIVPVAGACYGYLAGTRGIRVFGVRVGLGGAPGPLAPSRCFGVDWGLTGAVKTSRLRALGSRE